MRHDRVHSLIRSSTLLLLAAMLGFAPVLPAEEPPDGNAVRAQNVAMGRVTYRVYCSNCHGDRGMGDGKLAELLKVPPADLTTLAARHDGEFPVDAVRATIDGRVEVKGHGMREMPIWGEIFQESAWGPTYGDESGEVRVERKIRELLAYLETLQQTSADAAPAE